MKRSPVPCHIVAGPLGAGKTTAILSRLKRWADRERTAVIVNDFGEAGIDGTILNSTGAPAAVDVTPIVGGCLCCTGPMYLRQALADLVRRPDVDRIIIEPSGVALLKPLKEDLLRIAQSEPIEIYPLITVLPPARITEGHYKALPFITQLVDEADYLVANKADSATEEQLEHFRIWTSRLQPHKRGVLVTSFGEIPDELFLPRAATARDGTAPAHAHDEGTCAHDHTPEDEHTHEGAHAQEGANAHPDRARGHWQSDSDAPVDIGPLKTLLEDLLHQKDAGGLQRCKGIVHTRSGWQLLQWTTEGLAMEPFPSQSFSRLEWIAADSAVDERIRRILP